ncbi:hypothetical protein M422DRAFT_249857 [Sphaerobolus stellatus SS14]|uniref:Uncharacterized protein n=1 Tax=Sphaerobolus stellatus (strain SS14) TaxID=990650 RepID=A0A0C9W4V4_SPHS4|nr:hypothetical protein M422DRAFT_249857 [Sphaerobolus stellatus SS14]
MSDGQELPGISPCSSGSTGDSYSFCSYTQAQRRPWISSDWKSQPTSPTPARRPIQFPNAQPDSEVPGSVEGEQAFSGRPGEDHHVILDRSKRPGASIKDVEIIPDSEEALNNVRSPFTPLKRRRSEELLPGQSEENRLILPGSKHTVSSDNDRIYIPPLKRHRSEPASSTPGIGQELASIHNYCEGILREMKEGMAKIESSQWELVLELRKGNEIAQRNCEKLIVLLQKITEKL